MIKQSNLTNFGLALQGIRKEHGYSISHVSKKTGIKRETIGNVEKGKSLPRYDTLDILSIFYKVNLHLMFEEMRYSKYYSDLYDKIDEIILSYDIKLLEQISDDYQKLIEVEHKSSIIDSEQLSKFELFIELIAYYYKKDIQRDLETAICRIVKSLTSKVSNSVEDILSKKYMDFMDLRLIILLAAFLKDSERHEDTIEILKLVIKTVEEDRSYNNLSYRLQVKAAFSLSYINFIIRNYEQSLEYANYGLEVLQKFYSNYMMAQLYTRKAIAMLRLGYPTHEVEDLMLLSLVSLRLQGEEKSLELYLNVYKEKYGFTVDECNLKILFNNEKNSN